MNKNWNQISWRTTALGIVTIAFGLVVCWLNYVARYSVWQNLTHLLPGGIALIVSGLGLIHARDHKTKD